MKTRLLSRRDCHTVVLQNESTTQEAGDLAADDIPASVGTSYLNRRDGRRGRAAAASDVADLTGFNGW